jgi:hypothetical protein
MKQLVLMVLLSGVLANVSAQFSGQYNALNITGGQNTFKNEIPVAVPVVTGSTYLDDDWQRAEITLKNGVVIDELPVRVEIEQANVEIQYQGSVRYLDLNEVALMNLIDKRTGGKSSFAKAERYAFNDQKLKGIVKVHSGKRYSVVTQFYIELLPANYNVAMDVGSKNHRKVKRERSFISQDGRLVLVKGSGKKVAKQLGAAAEDAIKLLKQHKLDLSKEADLNSFVDLLNQG